MEYIKAIKDEIEKANKRNFLDTVDSKMDKNIKLVKLTPENVVNVETMIRYNSTYSQFDYINHSDEKIFKDVNDNFLSIVKNKKLKEINEKKDNKHSSTYYIKAFKNKYFTNKSNEKDNDYKNLLYIILRKINNKNSTRASLSDIEQITEKIFSEYTPRDLLENLKETRDKEIDECNYKLIKDICIKTNQKNKDKIFDRYNFSLSTKFCHYMNFNIFDGTEYQDLFSIYDTVVKNNLEYYYFQEFNEPIPDERNYLYSSSDLKKQKDVQSFLVNKYKNFQFIIDEILKKHNYQISRNGFDHLIWYTNKGAR